MRENEIAFLESRFRGFSCPQEGLDEGFLGLVAATYARETTRRFLSRHRAELTRRGHRLVGFVEDWLSHEMAFEMVWDPAVGSIFRATQVGNVADAATAAAALALRVSASGRSGEWSLVLGKPVRLQWGRWLLPTANQIAVICNGTAACVRCRFGDDNREVNFTRTDDDWQADDADSMPQFGTQYKKITVLPATASAADSSGAFEDPLPVAEKLSPEIVRDYQEPITLLAEYSPIYLPWVLRVLRYIIPLRETDIRSGSVEDQFGVVCVSLGLNAVALAESFVHEASHQYLHLLCRLGPLDDGTDANFYYSPVMRMERPLSRIVVAYHAFANLVLFYRFCVSNGVADEGYCARREAELASQVEQLESPLRTNQALTPIGRGLCDPLIERLQA